MDGEEIALVDAKDVSGVNSLQDLVNEVRCGTVCPARAEQAWPTAPYHANHSGVAHA